MPHTPGPWATDPSSDHLDVLAINRPGGRDITKAEYQANARLIAAAPELLDALRAILNSDMAQREEDEGCVSVELSMARVAIAKATGEIP